VPSDFVKDLIILTPEKHILPGFFTVLSDSLIFFFTFRTENGKTEYAETKFTTETTSKAFTTTDTGYQVAGVARFAA
jgi:hypothetical protein